MEGHWPRLAYVTDAGYHPTEYFDNVLKLLKDPRCPDRHLEWTPRRGLLSRL